MDEGYVNDPGTTLTANINNSTTSIPVATGAGYPTTKNFRVLIGTELLLVTANSGATPDTWTATRGIEGTTAASHLSGVQVNMVVTKGMIDQIRADLIKSGTFANLPAAGNAGDLYVFEDSHYEFARDNGSGQDLYLAGSKLVAPTGFAWQNQSTASLITTFGGESILSAVGGGGNNVNGRYVAYPSAPFTRDFCLRIWPQFINGGASPFNGTGGIYVSDGTKIEYFAIYGLSQMAVQYGPSLTTITTNVVAPVYTGLLSDRLWIRFDDGVNSSGKRTYSYSVDDGKNWAQFYQSTNTANLTPTSLGFFAQAYEINTKVLTTCLHYA